MFETQMASLADLNAKASQSIVKYYRGLDKSIEDKLDLIEAALANLDILLMYITQVRYDIRMAMPTIPMSAKSAAYECIDELRTIQDSAKTVSFNLTAAMHSLRDRYKTDLG